MNFLAYLYRRAWPRLLLACATSLVGGVSGVALISLMASHHSATLPRLAILFFGLCALHLLARTAAQVILLGVTQAAILDIRVDLSRKLLATPLHKLRQLGKPELLAVLTRDVESLIAAMTTIPPVMTHAAVLIGCMAYMAWLAWKLFLLFAVALVAGLLTYSRLKHAPLRQMPVLRSEMALLYGWFRDLVEGSRELQLNQRRGELFIEQVLAPDAERFRKLYVRTYSRLALITNFGDVLFYLVIGGLLFIAPLWLDYADSVFTAFAMVLLYLIGPVSTSINAVPVIVQGAVAYRQIQQLDVHLDDEAAKAVSPDPFADAQRAFLELNNVGHHYPGSQSDDRFLLGPLNLKIQLGEILFIIGGNGSGKTTLAMLLLGLYLPERGTLALNGVAVSEANVGHYRNYFSAVFADFHLFQHLLLDLDEDALARAAAYLHKLGIGRKVSIDNGKFSTIDLSSGQRKRLALVAAYLEDRAVYLFDEWAADQDPVFKRVFYTELLPDLRARGKTVIVISHDDAYFAQADRVVMLQDGKLIPMPTRQHHAMNEQTSLHA